MPGVRPSGAFRAGGRYLDERFADAREYPKKVNVPGHRRVAMERYRATAPTGSGPSRRDGQPRIVLGKPCFQRYFAQDDRMMPVLTRPLRTAGKKFCRFGNILPHRRVFTYEGAEAPTLGPHIGSCAIRGELRSFFFFARSDRPLECHDHPHRAPRPSACSATSTLHDHR